MEFLSGPGAKIELLHHAHRPAVLAFAVTLPEKDRAQAAIHILDAAAKANGELGRLPSDLVKELEVKYKAIRERWTSRQDQSHHRYFAGQARAAEDAKPLPILVLHTEDASAAAA